MALLKGKTALVTGGAAGIGKGIAVGLAEEGATVVVSDVSEAAGRQVVAEIEQKGGKGLFVRQDVTNEAQWVEVMDTISSTFGPLHVLVNNAGITERGDVETISLEDWNAVHAVNSNGVFLGTKYGIKSMKETGGGSIINISSAFGLIGDPNVSAYAASKGGVRLFSKSAALLCAREKYNVRVNSVHPGIIRTAMMQHGVDQADDPVAELQRYTDWVPLGILGEPEDVAWGAIYLASDRARHVTGTELVIDGGWTCR